MARLLSSQYPMTRGQLKKNTPNDGGKSRRKGGGNDANRDEENSGTPLAGAHTVDDDNTKKATSTSTSANTAGAHISDLEESDPPTSSRSVKQLLASHAADDPFWGGQDRTDDYSVDTEDSAQNLVGVHACDFVPPNDAERILAHAIHLCPQVCRYVWFNLRQLSAVTRQEGATLAPLSPEENRRRVCTRNCRQMWQQMADAAAQQGIPFPPMRNGIPDFRAVAERGAHFAQNLVGFHACDQQDCEEDKEILAMEEEREEARLIALDQQRLDALLGSDTTDDDSEDLDEESARLIAVEWINTTGPDDKSDLLQDMDNLDLAVLITSNIDCDLKGNIPHEPDFRLGQHRI